MRSSIVLFESNHNFTVYKIARHFEKIRKNICENCSEYYYSGDINLSLIKLARDIVPYNADINIFIFSS